MLNLALEVPDDLCKASKVIERVQKLPMRDFVEETGVQKRLDEACAFLDDAGLHDKATYIHCKAGKSRSVMIVLAFLIHRVRRDFTRSC